MDDPRKLAFFTLFAMIFGAFAFGPDFSFTGNCQFSAGGLQLNVIA
jgi:hypothetical protein